MLGLLYPLLAVHLAPGGLGLEIMPFGGFWQLNGLFVCVSQGWLHPGYLAVFARKRWAGDYPKRGCFSADGVRDVCIDCLWGGPGVQRNG